MRGLSGLALALALTAVGGVSAARAQTQTDIVCAAFEQKWNQISGGTDAPAMQALIGHIPPSCSFKARAERRLRAVQASGGGKSERSESEADSSRRVHPVNTDAADDSAYAIAKAASSAAAYQAYLSAYPRGRHASEARAAMGAGGGSGQAQQSAPSQRQLPAGTAYQKGEAAFANRDYDEAMRWYRMAADQGDVNAELAIGGLYYFGEGVTLDYAAAMRWYRMAADHGSAAAEYAVGSIYEHGQSVVQDYGEALRWYRMAAAQNYARAEVNIGNLFLSGEGVAKNPTEAYRQFKLAADQHDPDGEYSLGVLYAKGVGVRKDMDTARQLMNAAAQQGDQDARAWLNHNTD